MAFVSKENKDRILTASQDKLIEVISDYISLTPDKKNITYTGQCPVCNANNGLLVTPDKNMFGCCKCKNFGGTKPLDFLLKKGLKYDEALEDLARILNIVIIENTPATTNKKAKKNAGSTSKRKNSFLYRFLSESGLTADDVKATVEFKDENRTVVTGHGFRQGSIDHFDNVKPDIDDVLIEYYDLEGKPVMYDCLDEKKRPTGRQKNYIRVRYQFPDEHLDSNRRPIKYKTPKNAGTHLYIPQKIRGMYQSGEKIERLFIQEGEKKTEKCCKHGIPSVGISGIQNFAYHGQVPPDLVKLIQKCQVKELVLLFDSDWNDISSNLAIKDDAQKRPLNFYYAAKNFQRYVTTLLNRNIYLDIFIGHIIKNKSNDKGVDDLLVNTLKDKESELAKDIQTLFNKKQLDGQYIQAYNITTMGEFKLRELWALNDAKAFAERHKAVLKDMPEFCIGQHQWRFTKEGKLENTRPIEPYEQCII